MQDRFKFRFWNNGEMHHNDFVVTATGFVGKITEEFLGKCVFNQEDLTTDKECVLMQCTGLKDKNGKLIYEGDIVKFKTELFGKPKQIIWNECHYILKDTFIILCDMEIKQFGLEIIGNIYENKELLNEI